MRSTPNNEFESAATRPRLSVGAIVGAAGFLGAYLSVSLAQSLLGNGDRPLPGAAANEVAAYIDANPLAIGATSVLQAISVVGFAVFVAALMPLLREAGAAAAGRIRAVGFVSVAAMLVSSALGTVASVLVASSSADVIATLRDSGFYAGGVANVATMGAFAFAASLMLGRTGQLGRPTRWFGYVAGVLAMLSVFSIVFFYASPLLPVGRLLCMVWTVVAAIVLFRRTRAARS